MLAEKDLEADCLCWWEKGIPQTAQNFLDYDKKYQKSNYLCSNFNCTKS